MSHNCQTIECYQSHVQDHLERVLPILHQAALGNFSERLDVIDAMEEFQTLYMGVNVLTEDLDALFSEKEKAKSILEESLLENTEELDKAICEIQQSHAQTKLILNNIGDGIIAIDTKGKILLANDSILEMCDIYETAALGENCRKIFRCMSNDGSHNDEEPLDAFVARHLLKGENVVRRSCNLLRRNNKSIPVSVLATPIKVQSKVTGAVIVIRDLTVERELESAKADLVSFASHQLLTPLTAIFGYAEMASEELKDHDFDDAQFAIQRILDSIQRMRDTVDSFLNISAIEALGRDVSTELVNVPHALSSIIVEFGAIGLKKNLQIHFERPAENMFIRANETYLLMAFQNVLSNAIKYTPENGRINVRSFVSDNFVITEIQDTGPGIPPDEKTKIFENRYRASNAFLSEGNGLGLYVVKKIVEAFNGRVFVESQIDQGTTFTLRFPKVTQFSSENTL